MRVARFVDVHAFVVARVCASMGVGMVAGFYHVYERRTVPIIFISAF